MKWTIRAVRPDDLGACAKMEALGFPPAEAADAQTIAARIAAYPQHFLVAADETDAPAGYIMGAAIASRFIADEMFSDVSCHDESNPYQAVFSLCVHPSHRKKGVGALLMRAFCDEARRQGRRGVTLTCKKEKIAYYARLGFCDCGAADSQHGGAQWYNMFLEIQRGCV